MKTTDATVTATTTASTSTQTIKIATWNVNSMHVRQTQVAQYLLLDDIDILAVQELKGLAPKFPFEMLDQLGYAAVINAQATYNGVAFIYKKSLAHRINIAHTVCDNPYFQDVQKRLITLELAGICTLVCAYMPNGESFTSDKFTYKMAWLQSLMQYLTHLQQTLPVMLLGDYNITVDAHDVYDAAKCEGGIFCSTQERELFVNLKNTHQMLDVLRHFNPVAVASMDVTSASTGALFTWWDYRLHAFRRNLGLRIDHIFAHTSLLPRLQSAYVNRAPRTWERPSDHTPVVCTLLI